jgi:hypothetical protein
MLHLKSLVFCCDREWIVQLAILLVLFKFADRANDSFQESSVPDA